MKFEDAPRLPKLPFIVGDAALLLLAGFIAVRHPNPLSPLPLLVITGCVAAGCLAFIVPIVINYVRDQEEVAGTLRRELSEQFKRLMAASEHLQHSTVQLKSIEEIATKNLQTAERLPYRLQEKIAEFNQQLAETENEEKEALEQELATLRSAENERLTTTADRIAKTVAEWTKLEAGTRQQLAAAVQLHEKLIAVLAAIDGKIAALEMAAKNAERLPAPPAITLVPAVPAREPPVVAGIESMERPANPPPPVAEAMPTTEPPPLVRPVSSPPLKSAPTVAASVESASAPSVAAKDDSLPETPPLPLRQPRAPRKSKTEASFPPEPSSPAAAVEPAERSTGVLAPPPSSPVSPAPVPPASEAAPPSANPVPATEPSLATPAPAPSAEPISAVAPVVVGSVEPPTPASAAGDSASASAPKAPRKPRAPRAPKPGETAPGAGSTPAIPPPSATAQPAELIAEPVTDEPPVPESFSQVPPEENLPLATPSADGRTRLTVTSYIGIGNKLYLRGEGPGLSATKGVPLQFVSIGRWRWETSEATSPVVCRIYKNDKLEAPIGPLTLAPGTEQEVSATF
jgi:hypothetical protein